MRPRPALEEGTGVILSAKLHLQNVTFKYFHLQNATFRYFTFKITSIFTFKLSLSGYFTFKISSTFTFKMLLSNISPSKSHFQVFHLQNVKYFHLQNATFRYFPFKILLTSFQVKFSKSKNHTDPSRPVFTPVSRLADGKPPTVLQPGEVPFSPVPAAVAHSLTAHNTSPVRRCMRRHEHAALP